MLKPKPMVKVRITGLKSGMKQAIEALYDLKLMHIVDHSRHSDDFFDIGNTFEEGSMISGQLVKASSMISFFKAKGQAKNAPNFAQARARFERLFSGFSKTGQRLVELTAKESELKQQLSDPMGKIKIDKKYLEGYENIVVFKGTVKKPVRQALEEDGIEFEMIDKKAGPVYAVVVFVPKKFGQKARAVLSNAGFSESQIPEDYSEKELSEKLEAVTKEIAGLKDFLEKSGQENSSFLLDYEFTLKQLNEKAETPLRFGVSENSFFAVGWVPEEKAGQLSEKLSGKQNGTVFVEFSQSKKGAPIALDNPVPVKPFEFFLELYTLPKYTEIDPSILMAFTFPLFFGFMLGDVGYGLVTLLLFWFLRGKTKGIANSLSGVLIWASLASIVFGFVFGEFFGYEFLEHPLLNRVHEPTLMLGIAVLVGFLHLNLGLVLGFYNELKSHGLKHAFLAKISWMVLEAGLALLAADALGFLQVGVLPGAIVSLAAVVMLYLGEGAKGIVELPSLFSNMLSYSRLFAVGLSSVSIALVVNEMAGSMLEGGGIIGIIIAVIILVLGHVLNIALGLLGPSLHSIRLHYVEFFSKFFHGGGTKYSPFGTGE